VSLRRRDHARSRIEQLVETAGRSRRPWTVFLDGYEIRSAAVGAELDRLLTYAGNHLQVVLTTRADPVLPLHRYRLAGKLLEVRAADLAFDDDEADSLLHAGGVGALDPDDVHALNTRLGGWAAGLRFALPALAGHRAPKALVSNAVTHNGNINAFLVEEVLDAQPPSLHELILTTSVPDTLPPSLLEELTGEPAAPTALRLMNANVFLERTPGDESCLRYVPFFRDLVRAQLAYEEPERCRELHRRVAAWYAARGEWDHVVTHLDGAGDRPDCGALFVDHLLVGRLLCERRDDSFRRLVATSPPSTGAPGMHLLAAATALAQDDRVGCSTHLEAARKAGPLGGRAGVTTAVLEALLAAPATDAGGADQLVARAEEAVAAQRRPVDPGADDTATVLLLARAGAALRLGAVERAERLLQTALGCPTASWSSDFRSRCLAHAAVLHARTQDVSRAVQEADEAVAASRLGPATPASTATTAHLSRAYAALLADDLVGARAHLAETVTAREPLWHVVQAMVAAGVTLAGGAVDHAVARLDAARGAAQLAGPAPTDWLRETMTELRDLRPRTEDARAGSVVLPQQRRAPALRGTDGRVVSPLTPREAEVLVSMSEWLTTEEIAQRLFVSVNTVRTHVRNILTKLGVNRRSAAIREALRLGLLTSEVRAVAGAGHPGVEMRRGARRRAHGEP
jgi:LuxR family transcriptional regulator, maltose regulon positive regulatory protein